MKDKLIQIKKINLEPAKISYEVHDNGGRPFKVEIESPMTNVKIYNNYEEPCKLLFTLKPQKIFIGKSAKVPMTEFSGGWGPDFDGNSILLHMGGSKYIFIGSDIFEFNAKSEIVEYVSLVGNNDVPYPYAVDKNNNYYLLIEDIIIKDISDGADDPYTYYYDINLITPDRGYEPAKQPLIKDFRDIVGFGAGTEQFTMRYQPDAIETYKRLSEDGQIYIKKKNGTKIDLKKEDYVDLMREFEKKIKTQKLSTKILQKRL